MKTRIIQTRFWDDDFVSELDTETKLLFIFLLTNNTIGLTGIYELPLRLIAFQCGLTEKKVINAFLKLEPKVIYDKGWIVIKNAFKYNNYASNQKQKIAYMKEWKSLPERFQHFAPFFDDADPKPKYKKGSRLSYRHREIAEDVLGRKLTSEEEVHHIDKDVRNNSIDNLAVVDKNTHRLIHQGKIDITDSSIILLSYYYHSSPKSKIRNQKTETINQKPKTEFTNFEDLTSEVCQEIASEYETTLQEVLDTKMDMEVWMGKSHKNKYKNYKLALMTWVRKNKQNKNSTPNANNFKRGIMYADE